jgi:general secretion pathway protein G
MVKNYTNTSTYLLNNGCVNSTEGSQNVRFTQSAGGFSIIELMVVLAIIALLLTVVAPRYQGSISSSKEIVLKENLSTIRRALDQHYADTGKFPTKLEDLVAAKYLRNLPVDPLTNRNDSWILIGTNSLPIQAKDQLQNAPSQADTSQMTAVIQDIRSGAAGFSQDGGAFSAW